MLPFAIADLPPQLQERVVCSISAAIEYRLPANLLLAVAEIEGGRPGQWVQNRNGTYDVGPMQFNTAYLRQLEQYGIGPADVSVRGCYPYRLAAWRIRRHIRHDAGDMWTRAANYHSRTYVYNTAYRAKLIRAAGRWAAWLKTYFATVDITSSVPTSPAPADVHSVERPTTRTGIPYVQRTITVAPASE